MNDQMRANKLWAQIEATFKQMDTAATELECFQALKKQETLSATHRISNLWEEVQKQKELERTLQKRYGDMITELERVQHSVDVYRQREAENAAKENDTKEKDTSMDDTDTAQDQSVAPDVEDAPKEEATAPNNDIAMEEVDAADGVGTSKEEVVEAEAEVVPQVIGSEGNSAEIQNSEETKVEPEVEEPRSEDGKDAADEENASLTTTGNIELQVAAEETA